MKDPVPIFRLNNITDFKPTPRQVQKRVNWLTNIASQNKSVGEDNTLLSIISGAKTIKTDKVVIDRPFTEIREFISGCVTVRAENTDEAVEITKADPIFGQVGGDIEVREVLKRD